MEEQSRVVISVAGGEQGGERPPGEPVRSTAILLVGVGLVVGLALGITFSGRSAVPATTTTEQGVHEPPVVTSAQPSPESSAERLAARVPGFADALVVGAAGSGGSAATSVWAATEPDPEARPLPLGAMGVDALHQWLAAVTDGRHAPGGSLWVGDEAYMEPVATEVSSAVWHAERPGELAWVESGASETPATLSIAHFLPGQHARPAAVAELDPRAEVVWWTRAGLVIHRGDELLLVSEEGEVSNRLEGVERFVAGGGEAGAAVVSGEAVLVSPDLSTLTPAPWDAACEVGSFGPGVNASLALVCPEDGLVVWRMPDGAPPLPGDPLSLPGLQQPFWSPDGRFVIVPSIDPLRQSTSLAFVDLVDGVTHEISYPGRVLDAVTLRSS